MSINRAELDKTWRRTLTPVDADKQAFVLLLNGKRVKTTTGKSVWTSKGAAKNALNNHMRQVDYYNYNLTIEDREEKNQAKKEWIEQNIQVVSIAEWEALKNK